MTHFIIKRNVPYGKGWRNIRRDTLEGEAPTFKEFLEANKRHLQGADLRGMVLDNIDLSGAKLTHADFYDANMYRANLRGARMQHATLSRADMRYADLTDANLLRAHLREADLSAADLSQAKMRHVNVNATIFTGVLAPKADFEGARHTEKAILDPHDRWHHTHPGQQAYNKITLRKKWE